METKQHTPEQTMDQRKIKISGNKCERKHI